VPRRAPSFALASLLALSSCGGVAPPPASAPSPLAGKPMPDFHRPTLDGKTVDTKGLRGRVVVVKFFADYCVPCKKTLPAAQSLHESDPNVAFVGISEDESADTALSVTRRYALTFPVVHDSGQVLSGRYRVSDLPRTFVAGPDGTVRWVGGADQEPDALERAVKAAEK
jgi:peroxiredoxin